ncbi:BnaC04g32100D [Brassica napus]|uniref:BnaC04g32100D protein n=1 Tax=Brassica napus TaxID=3708 RepID=A0A078HG72_BRANA|nr:BnaC04g32100D [Brassica napus]
MRSPRSSSCSKCSSSSSSSSYSLAATSLKSRLLTIFKKAQELTTLCDIEACVIHYGPDGEMRTWPENRDIVRSLALRYIQLDQAKRRKKSVNLYEFLNKNKDNKTMLNKFKKRNVEELKYPISDHYTPDQINQLIHSLEQSYSKLQERRRFLAAKANLDDQSCVYDQNNNNYNFQHLCLSDYSTLHYQLMPYGGSDQNMMCMVNNFQHPCVSSNTTDYSVFPLELQESVSNYELNQLMPHELNYGFDQNMCMADTTNSCNIYPSFSHDFNPVMSSSYVDENRLLRASTLPYL